jgi:hypothetical protein
MFRHEGVDDLLQAAALPGDLVDHDLLAPAAQPAAFLSFETALRASSG